MAKERDMRAKERVGISTEETIFVSEILVQQDNGQGLQIFQAHFVTEFVVDNRRKVVRTLRRLARTFARCGDGLRKKRVQEREGQRSPNQ